MTTAVRSANRIRIYRQEQLLSIAELARRCGVARPTLAMVESGRHDAWPKIRAALARELGVDERVLFPEGG